MSHTSRWNLSQNCSIELGPWFLTMLFPPTKVSGASGFSPKRVKSLARGSASPQPSSILRRRSVEMRSSFRPRSMRTMLAALPVWYRSRSFTLPRCHLRERASICRVSQCSRTTNRVGEETFEMYLRYRYRYMKGCIFCIFQILRYIYSRNRLYSNWL